MARHTFIFSDESVLNSLGFRMMNEGGMMKQYKKNPLVLWMHRRPAMRGTENNRDQDAFPIGLGYNVRLENNKWLVDVEFDSEDPFAKKIEKKVERKIIRMASPGVEPIEWSDDKNLLLKGQKHATLTKWELVEISIVDIGSNPNAIKLYNNNKELIELSAGNYNEHIPLVNSGNKETLNNKDKKNMEFQKEVAILLGKDSDASANSILTSLKSTLELSKEVENWKAKHDTLQNEVKTINENAIVTLVNDNVDKKITADKKDFYVQLGKDSGIKTLKGVLDNMPDMATVTGTMQFAKNPAGEGKPGNNDDLKKWEDLTAKGHKEVVKLRKENPQKYIQLFKEEYGFEPSLEEEDED